MWVRPKRPTAWQSFNFAICFAFDGLIFYTCGLWGLLYLVIGTLVGMGYHPCGKFPFASQACVNSVSVRLTVTHTSSSHRHHRWALSFSQYVRLKRWKLSWCTLFWIQYLRTHTQMNSHGKQQYMEWNELTPKLECFSRFNPRKNSFCWLCEKDTPCAHTHTPPPVSQGSFFSATKTNRRSEKQK